MGKNTLTENINVPYLLTRVEEIADNTNWEEGDDSYQSLMTVIDIVREQQEVIEVMELKQELEKLQTRLAKLTDEQ